MQLLPNGKQQFLDSAGNPLANGKVYFYQPGTSTPSTTYQDTSGTTANPNPVVLDGNGQAVIFGTGSYRQVVQDANGQTIWDQETIAPDASFSDLSSRTAGKGASMVALQDSANYYTTKNVEGALQQVATGKQEATASAGGGTNTQPFGDTTGGIAKGREYWDGSHAFYRTNNMYYANSQWNRDDATCGGSKVGLGSQSTADTWGSWNIWSFNSTVPWNNAAAQSWATDGIPMLTWGGAVGETLEVNLPSSSGTKIGAMTITGWTNTAGGATSHTFFSLGSDSNIAWDVPANTQHVFKQNGVAKAWLPFTDGNNYFGAHVYPTPGDTYDLGSSTNKWANIWCDLFYLAGQSVATASLPAAGSSVNGRLLYENAGGVTRNLVFYIDGARFRISATSF
jgi:hypothetical protein